MVEKINQALLQAGCTRIGNLVWTPIGDSRLLNAINEACQSSFTSVEQALHTNGFKPMGTSKGFSEWIAPEVAETASA